MTREVSIRLHRFACVEDSIHESSIDIKIFVFIQNMLILISILRTAIFYDTIKQGVLQMDREKFSERLRVAREQSKMTQTQLADKAGMKQSKISTYESRNSTTVPSLDAAASLAAALDVSLDWLAGISDELNDQQNIDTVISGADFLRKLIDLLLHDGAEWIDKSYSSLSGDGVYIRFGGGLLNSLNEDMQNLFKLRDAIAAAGLPEDTAAPAISATIEKIVCKYGDCFEGIPF